MSVASRRRFLWLPLLGLLTLFGCASLLDADGYESSPETLCDLLDRCFTDEDLATCRAKVDGALDGAAPEVRAKWLASFLDLSCAKQCSGARRCLDLDPLCTGATSTCTRNEDCCGFLTGSAACEPFVAGGPGQDPISQCCRPLGVDCSDGAPCCGGLPCDAASGTCGGVVCKEPKEPCTDNAECCTKTCVNRGPSGVGECGEQVCFEPGFPCITAEECCEGLACENGACRLPTCAPTGAPCDPNAAGCCDGYCQPVDVSGPTAGPTQQVTGVCIKDGCFPRDAVCDPKSGVSCCGETDCVKVLNRCGTACSRQGAYCVKDADCCGALKCDQSSNSCEPCSNGWCNKNEDCCTGKCNTSSGGLGVCEQPCATAPEPTCSHDMNKVGGLLAVKSSNGTYQHCDNSANKFNIDPKCVEYVCDADPACCCQGWDILCAADTLKCKAPCQTVPSKCSHGMETAGEILAEPGAPGYYNHCDPTGTGFNVKAKCVEAVCNLDPVCCCSGWDATCIKGYKAQKAANNPACL